MDRQFAPSENEWTKQAEPPRETLLNLVDQLPEIYQPIYGHPNLASSRLANNPRLEFLLQIVTLLSEHLGRPLRVLDLGSAQGYLAFRLAEQSHHVTGIDYLPINVAVARAIADENPDLDVMFVEGDLLDAASLVNLNDFDLVVGFSVLHHVAHRDGHAAATALVARLVESIPHAVFEMAVASEPVYWADALASDPRITLSPYPFIRELGRTDTHLGEVRRPVLYCSRSLALVEKALEPIQSWFDEPHDSAEGSLVGARRYFVVPSGLATLTARFSQSVSSEVLGQRRTEARRCAHVLMALADTEIEAPDLLEFVEGPDEAVVVQTMLPGARLDQVVGILDQADRTEVTTQVLLALAQLEENGLYHDDLRLWNVLWDHRQRRARLIDYGAISDSPGDTAWPDDGYFSLLAFIVALWGTMSDQTGLRVPRASRIASAVLPNQLTALVGYLMVHPRDDRVIRDLSSRWEMLTSSGVSFWPDLPLAWDWLATIEVQRDELLKERETASQERDAASQERDAASQERDAASQERDAASQERDAALEARDSLKLERDALVVTRDSLLEEKRIHESAVSQLRNDIQQATAQLALVQQSKSWRLTAPLRRIRALGKR